MNPSVLFSLLFFSASAAAQTTAPAAPETAAIHPTDISQASPVDPYLPPVPPGVVPPRASGLHVCREPPYLDDVGGITVLTFTITPQGTVADSTVVRSSGFPSFDELARDCVYAWLYSPATKDGHPISFQTAVGVGSLVKLPDEPPVRGASVVEFILTGHNKGALEQQAGASSNASLASNLVQGPARTNWHYSCESWQYHNNGVLLAYNVDPEGSVKDISVLNSSGNAEEDADAIKCIAKRAYRPAMQNGRPVEVRLTERLY